MQRWLRQAVAVARPDVHGVTKPVDVIASVNGVSDVEHVGRLAATDHPRYAHTEAER